MAGKLLYSAHSGASKSECHSSLMPKTNLQDKFLQFHCVCQKWPVIKGSKKEKHPPFFLVFGGSQLSETFVQKPVYYNLGFQLQDSKVLLHMRR